MSTSNGNSSDDSNTGRREESSERSHRNQAFGRGGRQRGRSDGKNHCNSTEHGWHDRPLRPSHQQRDDTQHANAALVGATEGSVSHAWCTQVEKTENADLESFQVVVGNGAECSPSRDKRYDEANTRVQEDVAFPAMMGIGIRTPPGDTAVVIDTAASHHMALAESQLCQHVVNQIDCSARVKGSCGLSSANSKGALRFRLRNDRGELVPIHLEVLLVPNQGANVFSVGALHEKGVKLDLLPNPPVLRDGNDAFPTSTWLPRMLSFIYYWMGKRSHITFPTPRWTRTRGTEEWIPVARAL